MINYEIQRKVETGYATVKYQSGTGGWNDREKYLNDKTVPSEQVQSDIAVSLGLAPDYFEQDENPVTFKPSKCEDGIQTLTVHEVAKLMHKHTNTIALGLQQGVFPWGYAIHTSEHRWSYFINAKRFAEIEGVTVSA